MIDKLSLKGRFIVEHVRNGKVIGEYDFHNDITNQGKDALLNIMFNGATQIPAWYVGLINNSGYTALAAGDTHASHSGWTESSDYDEATRPAWTEGAASGQVITNAAPVVFTISATVGIRGIFIASIDTKGSTGAATLWATALFSANLPVIDDDVLRITYSVSA